MPGPRGEVEEDDGVLLGMVFDGERMRTSLVVRSHACPASARPPPSASSVYLWRRYTSVSTHPQLGRGMLCTFVAQCTHKFVFA